MPIAKKVGSLLRSLPPKPIQQGYTLTVVANGLQTWANKNKKQKLAVLPRVRDLRHRTFVIHMKLLM